MSEYQHYEFVAVDGPISDAGLRYARGCSSRAEVSRFRWHNVYHFGDFHGKAETLLKHYDAHFYLADWGTVRLGLAFPEGSLAPLMDQKATAAYDQVATHLRELRDAHEQAGHSARFQQALTAFRKRYARRPAMLRRIEEL